MEDSVFSLLNNTDEFLEFEIIYPKGISKEYSLYPSETYSEEANPKETLIVKLQYNYGNTLRDYELNPGKYSFEKEAILKNLQTNKFFGNFPVKVSLRNLSKNIINVRISSNGIGNDSEFSLNQNDIDSWERYSGEVILQVRERNFIYKYLVDSPGEYFYEKGELCNKNIFFENDTKNLKFEKDIGSVYLKNKSNGTVNVRISSNGMGNSDFWKMDSNKDDSWNRFYGKVFLEVKNIFDGVSFQFEVDVPGRYVYFGEGKLLEEFDKKEVHLVKNAVFS